MKMTLSKLILALAAMGALPVPALAESFAGGWSGNGGDLHAAAGNAWFAGDEPIEACVVTQDFPTLTQAEALILVREAVADWQAFFAYYRMTSQTFNKAGPRGSISFPDGEKRGLSTTFDFKDCNDLVNEESAVRFTFGKPDEAVAFFREMATENAFGLALRRAYDHKDYRSGGTVWISNELKKREDVKHLLLHELGHVFGMQHNSVFVMDEDVVRHVSDLREGVAAFLGSIESPAWRYALRENSEVVLTGHGRSPLPDALQRDCPNQQYRPNHMLPPYVSRHFGLKPGDCHRIVFGLRGARQHAGRLAKLTLKELGSGREFSWDAEFYPEPDSEQQNLGPGIFTQWIFGGPLGQVGKAVWKRMTLDNQSPTFPAQGSMMMDGQRHALQIAVFKGLRLQIFLPEVGRYWVLRTVHDHATDATESSF